MHSALQKHFDAGVRQYVSELAAIESTIGPSAAPEIDGSYARLRKATHASAAICRELEQLTGDDDDLLQELREDFRRAIAPWYSQSWFMERAREKPRGYPGDYQLLTGIYDNAPRGVGIGGYLDLYFLNTTLAHAVRSRVEAARGFLEQEVSERSRKLRILNVACGPCREFTHNWTSQSRHASVTLIDMDPEALAFADEAIRNSAPHGVSHHTRIYNALRMSSAEKNIREFGVSDIIYSIGLCDYIPDNALIRILRGWRESLAPEGVVYVAFKDRREYRDTTYAWHVDWHFVPRTEEDCRRLFREAGYDMDQVAMSRADSPVIMNFICRLHAEGPIEVRDQTQVDSTIGVP